MAFLVGVDEAGYGPNLGPLVIGGTVWEVSDHLLHDHDGLAEAIGDCIDEQGREGRLAVADSKQLYKPKGSLRQLELGVHSALALLGRSGATWRSAFASLCPAVVAELDATDWYAGYDEPLPLDTTVDEVSTVSRRVEAGLAQAGVRLCGVAAEVVLAERFNGLLDRWDGKGALLSNATLDLVERLLELTSGPTLIHCDKQGGRNKYGPLLQTRFPDDLIQVRWEGREESCYEWGPRGSLTRCRFVAKGDRFLPAALASMIAKYLRELSMRAFNRYWAERVPGIKPTAGYPQDAKRFQAEIQGAQERLEIASDRLWRRK